MLGQPAAPPSSSLGAVVLCVTGAEALYADTGALRQAADPPGLVLGGHALRWCSTTSARARCCSSNPAAVKNPFFLMAPDWALLPLVLLATAATVIASQAVITGAFSVTRQAIQLGYLPRLRIEHTSVRDTGQIYMPFVNWSLFVTIVLAVVMFRSSSNLAAAYGIAVTTDMLITTVLTFFVIRYAWKLPLLLASRPRRSSSSSTSPSSRRTCSSCCRAAGSRDDRPVRLHADDHLEGRPPPHGRSAARRRARPARLPRGGVRQPAGARRRARPCSSTAEPGNVPNALLHNLKHNKVLHEQNLFVTVRNHEVPWIPMDKRIEMERARPSLLAGHRPLRLQERRRPAARAWRHARLRGCQLEPMTTSLLPVARRRHPDAGQRHGALAREALRAHAPQRERRGGFFLPNNSVVELVRKSRSDSPPGYAHFVSLRLLRPGQHQRPGKASSAVFLLLAPRLCALRVAFAYLTGVTPAARQSSSAVFLG